MPDLAELLRSGMADVVDDLSPSPGLDDLVRRRVRRRERHRRLATAMSAVVALAVGAAGVGALSLPGGGERPSVVAGPAAPDAGADGDGDGMLFLLADPPPAGFEKPIISGGAPTAPMEIEVSPGWEHTLRFVDFDAAGQHPERILDVQWGPRGAPEKLDLLRADAGVVDAAVRGRDGLASPAGGWLAWSEPDGEVVRLTGQSAPAGDEVSSPGRPLDGDLLAEAAEALVPREGAGFGLPDPPDGFEQVAEWPNVVSVSLDARQARYERPDDGATLYVTVSDEGGMPPGASLATAEARRVEVRGRPAVVSTVVVADTGTVVGDPIAAPGQIGDVLVEWIEPSGELVTVGGTGMAAADLLAVAEDLVEVDAKTWFALAPRAGDAPVGEIVVPPAPSTTPSAPDPTSADPAGVVPAAPDDVTAEPAVETPPGVVRAAGSYAGMEHYTFTDGACPDLDHVLDMTYTLTDGTTWQFHGEYCGDLEGELWSGLGEFSLTVPDGDVITGVIDVGWVVVPTSGGPSLMAITGGTGRYDGASGVCELDNHISQIEIGVQEHSGTFVCVLAP
jgi:hypothetical protein